uniref:G_PROTEIN_RECEP_F1_2 domain-containing protein n=1 Tax=Rhabditophanes sp. KR3021 TaxID=114890 RepID=A0AC35U0P4_9BILA
MNETLAVISDAIDTIDVTKPTTVGKSMPLGVKITIIAYCYILPVICVFGIIGNIMNVITLASRRLKAVSYMYLKALAIADLLCMIFVLLFVTSETLVNLGFTFNRRYLFGFYQAHLMLSLINWALSTGVFVVVALSIERFVSIVFPLHFRAWNSPSRVYKAIAIAYTLPAIMYIPYGFGRYSIGSRIADDGHVVYMAIDSEISLTFEWQIYKWTRECLLRFVPIVTLTILNGKIMFAFRKRQKMFARLTKKSSNPHSSKDENLLYLLGGIVVMFFICNIPAAINLVLINETVKKRVDYQIFRAVANLLEITNHASQFYIFISCSTDYRVTFLQKFPCFKTYATNRDRLRTYLRRTPTNKSLLSGHESVSALMASDKGAVIKRNRVENSFTTSGTVGVIEPCNSSNITALAIDNDFLLKDDPTNTHLPKDKTIECSLASGEEDLYSEDISLNSLHLSQTQAESFTFKITPNQHKSSVYL